MSMYWAILGVTSSPPLPSSSCRPGCHLSGQWGGRLTTGILRTTTTSSLWPSQQTAFLQHPPPSPVLLRATMVQQPHQHE